jgi:hypothetical protein
MPDLVGHDRRPAAFIVYLYLSRHAAKIRRGLIDPGVTPTVSNPVRRILRPWERR